MGVNIMKKQPYNNKKEVLKKETKRRDLIRKAKAGYFYQED